MNTENSNSNNDINTTLTKGTTTQVKKPKKPNTFQLCFAVKEQIGKSNIKIGKPLTIGANVTPKFYVNDQLKCSNLTEQLNRLNVHGPRDKYNYAITENQRYGWYQNQLIDIDKDDSRLHFAKHTNELIVEYLRTKEKIRP